MDSFQWEPFSGFKHLADLAFVTNNSGNAVCVQLSADIVFMNQNGGQAFDGFKSRKYKTPLFANGQSKTNVQGGPAVVIESSRVRTIMLTRDNYEECSNGISKE